MVAILVAILDLTLINLLYQQDKYSFRFPAYENILLDTKTTLVAALESKIWLLLYFGSQNAHE